MILQNVSISKHCAILGIEQDFDDAILKSAFRSKIKEHHPDKNIGEPVLEEKSKRVIESYSILKDELNRGRVFLKKDYSLSYPLQFDVELVPAGHTVMTCSNCNGEGFRLIKGHSDISRCLDCIGTIYNPFFGTVGNGLSEGSGTCKRCNGMKKIIVRKSMDKRSHSVPCNKCNGTGKSVMPCPACHGRGVRIVESRDTRYKCNKCSGTGKTVTQLFNPVFIKGSLI